MKILTDEQLDAKISKQFTELTGLEPAEISQALGVSPIAHIHTEDRTFICELNLSGSIKKGTLEEEI